MPYDPQASRRRPQPAANDPAPVDALLGAAAGSSGARPHLTDDPPPTPAVTPAPADPPSDTVLLRTTVAGALGTLLGLLTLRHLWRRHRRLRASRADS
ncbi:MAG: hypothetical protein R2695_20680 [Acidimicrobiales bacterium]